MKLENLEKQLEKLYVAIANAEPQIDGIVANVDKNYRTSAKNPYRCKKRA